MKKVNILGVEIDNINFQQTLEKIGEYLNSNKQHYIVTPNPEICLAAQKDKELREIINKADLSLPDGFGLILMSKLNNRVTGTDVFLETIKRFKVKYKFVVREDGLSTKEEIIKKSGVEIDEENPDFIFVGLGAPDQEKWIHDNREKYPSAKVLMVIGGGFDFLTGKQKRAPRFMRKLGLEWVWRLLKQPKRYKRIFNATLKFAWKVIASS